MPVKRLLQESELAALARECRVAAGKNRAQAARDLMVARQAVIYAEDHPGKSFTKLRCRMIEVYSGLKVIGPVFVVKRKK
jgi:hypothetical protein